MARFRSLEEARKWEIRVSSMGIARQQTRRTHVFEFSVATAVRDLANVAERVASIIGVEWGGLLFRIRPPSALTGLKPLNAGKLAGSTYKFLGYWGGLVLLSSENSSLIAVRASELLHRDSIESIMEG